MLPLQTVRQFDHGVRRLMTTSCQADETQTRLLQAQQGCLGYSSPMTIRSFRTCRHLAAANCRPGNSSPESLLQKLQPEHEPGPRERQLDNIQEPELSAAYSIPATIFPSHLETVRFRPAPECPRH